MDKILLHWCSIFGFMHGLLHDNGGEFTGGEFTEITSVEDHTTGAESPFQNGLCGRIHTLVDIMLLKMEEDNPGTPFYWHVQIIHEIHYTDVEWLSSSHQLVLGENPNLPGILTATPPALQGVTTSEVLAKHSFHSARKNFIALDADERVCRALRTKMRPSEERYVIEDYVYYKIDGSQRWLGPAKVIFKIEKLFFAAWCSESFSKQAHQSWSEGYTS